MRVALVAFVAALCAPAYAWNRPDATIYFSTNVIPTATLTATAEDVGLFAGVYRVDVEIAEPLEPPRVWSRLVFLGRGGILVAGGAW